MSYTGLKYTGSTPGADSNNYVLFDTTVACPGARYLQQAGCKRLMLDIKHDQSMTLKWYKPKTTVLGEHGRPRPFATSTTDWEQIGDSGAIAAPAATATTTYDILVDAYPDFVLVATNGGSAQTKWIVNMSLTNERVAGT